MSVQFGHQYSCSFITLSVAYDLTAPFRSKTFNFNNFVSELDVDQFLADLRKLPFNCDKSHFVDKDRDHILTGDLG